MQPDRINTLKNIYRTALLDDVIPFWMNHGIDYNHGGFFTCLDRDGSAYSTDKSVWFAGRTIWTYATLYRQVEPRKQWLDLALHGYRFLVANCFDEKGKMFFSVDRTGQPLQMRRYYFSEVFAVLALTQLAHITKDASIQSMALRIYESLQRTRESPEGISPKINPQTRPSKSLSPLMCFLSVTDALAAIEPSSQLEEPISVAIGELLSDFVKFDSGAVLETVAPDGSRIDSPEGRVMNPGHAIETAWFVMEVAHRRDDKQLIATMAQLLLNSLDCGWDTEHGGLLYFVDVEGKPSPYIEHDMKLWWPHCEALYATLLAYQLTGDSRFGTWHERIHAWAFEHFPDPEYGEWFGYLRRDGIPSSALKGSMWKGPFHLPRALLLCWKLLESMSANAALPPTPTENRPDKQIVD